MLDWVSIHNPVPALASESAAVEPLPMTELKVLLFVLEPPSVKVGSLVLVLVKVPFITSAPLPLLLRKPPVLMPDWSHGAVGAVTGAGVGEDAAGAEFEGAAAPAALLTVEFLIEAIETVAFWV